MRAVHFLLESQRRLLAVVVFGHHVLFLGARDDAVFVDVKDDIFVV